MKRRLKFEIDERPPCKEWVEYDDTGYCANCGGPQAVHEPWIHYLFDLMEKAR